MASVLTTKKFRAVQDFPRHLHLKQLWSVFGLSSYFRWFMRGFADIAERLLCVLLKIARLRGLMGAKMLFESLRSALIFNARLWYFFEAYFSEIHTDASGTRIGTMLLLKSFPIDTYHVISYARLSLRPRSGIARSQRSNIVCAIGRFRPYLYGHQLTVVTGHHILSWFGPLRNLSVWCDRRALRLEAYSFVVTYKRGIRRRDMDGFTLSSIFGGDSWDRRWYCNA